MRFLSTIPVSRHQIQISFSCSKCSKFFPSRATKYTLNLDNTQFVSSQRVYEVRALSFGRMQHVWLAVCVCFFVCVCKLSKPTKQFIGFLRKARVLNWTNNGLIEWIAERVLFTIRIEPIVEWRLREQRGRRRREEEEGGRRKGQQKDEMRIARLNCCGDMRITLEISGLHGCQSVFGK